MIRSSLFARWLRNQWLILAGFVTSLGMMGAALPPAALDHAHPAVQSVIAVQQSVTAQLMTLPEILGTAVGVDDAGKVSLLIYVDQDNPGLPTVVGAIPTSIQGVPVRVELTDAFRALRPGNRPGGGGGGSGTSHTAKQTPPISLGTSGGWGDDLANGYCCGGTLGSLVTRAGRLYVLSNYHVLESDIVSGGNGIVASAGDSVIQPGLIDVNCNEANAQAVATLVLSRSLPNSNVDAAIAEVIPGKVRTDGAILEIGTISSQVVGASINQAVKKSGRTTKLTRSKVSGLNATVSVAYDNECAGGPAFTKTFTGQIIIANRGSKFLAGGDSGSLMVEDVAASPRAVGLLFAGSSTLAVANPIGEVLGFLGASMVGN